MVTSDDRAEDDAGADAAAPEVPHVRRWAAAGSDPAGSDPAGSDPAGSDPAGSDPAGSDGPLADVIPLPDTVTAPRSLDGDRPLWSPGPADHTVIGAPADPIEGPERAATETDDLVAVPRLARHEIVLDDDHRVGVAVCGRGLPVVLVHGFTAEGILYAQTLSRLVAMGFKVVAVDVAGHGATQGLPTGGDDLQCYTDLLARVLDELGIRRAVFAGHSMGGRLVAQLATADPQRAIAVVLIDAVVGECWDRLIRISRFVPPVIVGIAALLVADTLSTLPWLRNPAQAAKLGRLVAPTLLGHARRPWRMFGPAISMMRSRPSGEMLENLGEAGIPVVVIHGDRDMPVPYATAKDAARRSGGTLVTVKGGTHSWVLKDPETLPAIVAGLLEGPLARVRAAALGAAGLRPDASPDQVESAFLGPHAWVRRLTPPVELRVGPRHHHRPRYEWTVEQLA